MKRAHSFIARRALQVSEASFAHWRCKALLVLQARENGEVLVERGSGDGLGWIEAPPFTADLRYAESLLSEGLLTFFRDVRRVCATALQARALANEPPPMVSNIVQWRRG
jgi:hypothetical protein